MDETRTRTLPESCPHCGGPTTVDERREENPAGTWAPQGGPYCPAGCLLEAYDFKDG